MDDDTTTPTDSEVSFPSSVSVLSDLKARREQILEKTYLDLAVPRWKDPEVLVRFRPASHPFIRKIQEKVERTKDRDRKVALELDGNIDLLIKCCVGVIARVDGQDYSLRPGDPKGDPTTFDPDLAANLGLEEGSTARQVVKALYFTDGDILSHAQAIIEWSGFRQAEADEQLEGE